MDSAHISGMHNQSLCTRCGVLFLAAAIMRVAVPVSADDDRFLILVFPLFGEVPPEFELPTATRIAESLMLELPANIRAVAETPAQMPQPGEAQKLARTRAVEMGAVVAIWGELMDPGSCTAPRLLLISTINVESGTVLKRNVCPEDAGPGIISRAIALATMNSLRSGLVKSMSLVEDNTRDSAKSASDIPEAPRCPEPPPPEKCPQVQCPPLPEPLRPRFLFSVGPLVSSHPNWDSFGIGAEIDFFYSPRPWLELGLGIQAFRGRYVKISNVNALYNDWPLIINSRFRFGGATLEGTADLGFMLAWTQLEALFKHPAVASVKSVTKWNPAISASLGLRWWTSWGIGLHLQAGPTVYLRRQLYRYRIDGVTEIVLSMQVVSLHASFSLVIPFG